MPLAIQLFWEILLPIRMMESPRISGGGGDIKDSGMYANEEATEAIADLKQNTNGYC
jgi:hypothetical protein